MLRNRPRGVARGHRPRERAGVRQPGWRPVEVLLQARRCDSEATAIPDHPERRTTALGDIVPSRQADEVGAQQAQPTARSTASARILAAPSPHPVRQLALGARAATSHHSYSPPVARPADAPRTAATGREVPLWAGRGSGSGQVTVLGGQLEGRRLDQAADALARRVACAGWRESEQQADGVEEEGEGWRRRRRRRQGQGMRMLVGMIMGYRSIGASRSSFFCVCRVVFVGMLKKKKKKKIRIVKSPINNRGRHEPDRATHSRTLHVPVPSS